MENNLRLILLSLTFLLNSQVQSQNYINLSTFGTQGTGNNQFNFTTGVSVVADGKIYVADQQNHRIQVLTQSGSTLGFYTTFGTQGSQTNQLQYPFASSIASDGKIFVSDQYNHRISIWVLPTPTNLTLTGLGVFTYTGSSFAAEGSTTVLGMVPEIKYNGSLTAPTNVGTYSVSSKTVYYYNGENFIAEGSGTLTIVQAQQTIAGFAVPSSVVLGAAPVSLSSTSNSALPVSYATTGNVLVQNNTLYFYGIGAASVTASQSGNGNHTAAQPRLHMCLPLPPL